jgi:hypothetical protein
MGTTPVSLGDPLPDDTIVFRAFSYKGHRQRTPPKVRPLAYIRAQDHIDGLSLGRTPEAAVAGLDLNYGYCSIRVRDIRTLTDIHKLPYKLEVRPDLNDPDHFVLCNLPIVSESDEAREWAQFIAGRLAKLSTPQCFDHYPPSPSEELPTQSA